MDMGRTVVTKTHQYEARIALLDAEVERLREENRLLELGLVNDGYGGVPVASINKIHAMMKENDRLKEEVERLRNIIRLNREVFQKCLNSLLDSGKEGE